MINYRILVFGGIAIVGLILAYISYGLFTNKTQSGPQHFYDIGDYAQAYVLASALEKQNDPTVHYVLGELHYTGRGVPKDVNLATKHFETAAKQGHVKSQAMLGVIYDERAIKTGKHKKALLWLDKAARSGNSFAQFRLGLKYYTGEGVTKNCDQAFYWTNLAAKGTYQKAYYNLGTLVQQGCGTPKNNSLAVSYFKIAATQQNMAAAKYNLGMAHLRGEGTQQDIKRANKLFEQAADQGYASAQSQLALDYYFGRTMPKNCDMAYNLASAAAQDNYMGHVVLGYQSLEGCGTKHDSKDAVEHFRIAATKGNMRQGQYLLGIQYLHGNGVTKNKNTAIKWFQRAADQGDKHAQKKLASLGHG